MTKPEDSHNVNDRIANVQAPCNSVRPTKFRHPVGVMQGRLLPKYLGRYQAHPVGYWQEEFPRAAECGLDCIEFIFDYESADQNPLLRDGGPYEILRVSEQTGVIVRTVCADYFKEAPLHHRDEAVVSRSQEILRRLLCNAKTLQLTDIMIPCVDQSSMRHNTIAASRFVEKVRPLLELAEKSQVNLSLETDLPPERFAELLAEFGSRRVTVTYDTGDSASHGYDPKEELELYGERISNIHIKDRLRGGGSVVLGNGDTRFERFFGALQTVRFSGPFIMQAYRDDEGMALFRSQFQWLTSRFQL